MRDGYADGTVRSPTRPTTPAAFRAPHGCDCSPAPGTPRRLPRPPGGVTLRVPKLSSALMMAGLIITVGFPIDTVRRIRSLNVTGRRWLIVLLRLA